MTRPTTADVERAAEAALRGELVVIPTDTVYGIGTRPDDPAATGRIFEAKQRPRDLELPVLAPSIESASEIAEIDGDALVLAERFWPGPLTLVVRRRPASASWQLGGNPDTVGVRVPNDRTALAVLARAGPLAVTSANRSGAPTPSTCREIAGIFGDAVAVTLCADEAIGGVSSTVVDCTAAPPTILRPGSVTSDLLAQVLDA